MCLKAPATADNRLGIRDFVAVAQAPGEAALSWTNPRHAPVQAVRVVTRQDRFPRGAEDGEVVYSDETPAIGQTIFATDVNE